MLNFQVFDESNNFLLTMIGKNLKKSKIFLGLKQLKKNQYIYVILLCISTVIVFELHQKLIL